MSMTEEEDVFDLYADVVSVLPERSPFCQIEPGLYERWHAENVPTRYKNNNRMEAILEGPHMRMGEGVDAQTPDAGVITP